jgi:hypothetical protein
MASTGMIFFPLMVSPAFEQSMINTQFKKQLVPLAHAGAIYDPHHLGFW